MKIDYNIKIIKTAAIQNPEVSVIIPVYNTEKYLALCLNSIINQTLKSIEIIIINDGSTDNSLKILKDFSQKDSRITLVSQKNCGLSASRNTGVKLSHGEFIHFMDSDDYLDINALKLMHQKCRENNLNMIFCNGNVFSDTKSLKLIFSSFLLSNYYKRKYNYPAVCGGAELFTMMVLNNEYRTQVCLQMINKTFFINNNLWFTEGILHEDNPYTFSCMLTAAKVGYIKAILLFHRLRPDSITTQNTCFKHTYGYFVSYIEMLNFLKKTNIKKEEKYAAEIILQRVLNGARRTYKKLPITEKNSVNKMSPEEYDLFKLYIA